MINVRPPSCINGSPRFCRLHALWRRRRTRLAHAAIGLGWLAAVSPVGAQQSRPGEYDVKAVYLYNFGRFIQWPATAAKDNVFSICVLGRDPFGTALDTTVAGETIDGQQLIAKRIASPRDATGCRILFISSSEAPRLKEILGAVSSAAVLTVSDLPGFTAGGGMIQFVLQDDKVRFEVNLTAAQKSGLALSSQLLKVASSVRQDTRSDDVKP